MFSDSNIAVTATFFGDPSGWLSIHSTLQGSTVGDTFFKSVPESINTL